MGLAEIKTKDLRWIDIVEPQKGEIEFLRNNFNFHPLNLEDCLISGQRPKIQKYPDYIFLVLLFPIYNRKTKEIEPSEIDFFISKDYIVTLHDNKLPPIKIISEKCQSDKAAKEKYLSKGATYILYEILNNLLNYCYPMLDHLSIDIRNIEKQIFTGLEKRMVSELLMIRRNITDFRKIMQAHKNTLKKLSVLTKQNELSTDPKIQIYYNDLIELSKEIWDHLSAFKESIEALQQTNESLISNRLNDIMKTFTTMSVVIFIMTLIASIFAIGAKDTPIINYPWAFWIILGILTVVASSFWQFFKRKKFL